MNNDKEIIDERTNGHHVGIDSELKETIKVGDHFWTADLVNDETGCNFDFKEYEVVKINKKIGKPDFYDIIDVRHPKVTIKSDLATGYFTEKVTAAEAMVDSLKQILEKAETALDQLHSGMPS